MANANAEHLHPRSLDEWHAWLRDNHERSDGVWVVFWRKESGNAPLDYDQVVREALCWGWVDGHTRTIDEHRRGMWFTRRGRTSAWAASNKARVADLVAEGRMQPAGQAVVDDAKRRGLWTLLDADPRARTQWDAWPPSVRKYALTQIAFARQPATKTRRIAGIVEKAARGERP